MPIKTQKVAHSHDTHKADKHCNLETESDQRADSVKILKAAMPKRIKLGRLKLSQNFGIVE